MTESALSLVERLRAALDRAEEIARAAKIQPQQIIEALGSVREADMKFIVINRPDVVLRTVAAHRKILEAHQVDPHDPNPGTDECAVCAFHRWPCPTVEALAAVYFPEAPDA